MLGNGSYLFRFLLIFSLVWFGSFWVFEDAGLCDFSHKQEYGDDWARIDGKFENPVFLKLAVGSHGIPGS